MALNTRPSGCSSHEVLFFLCWYFGATCADARVPNSNGTAQKASGLAQVTRRDVGNVVVAAEFLARVGRYWAGCSATHDAVCAASLIHKARLGARAHYLSAGLLAAAAVHDAQVWVSATARGAQFAFVPVGGAIRAADLEARGNPLAVGHALAVWTAPQHAARLAGAALHSVARIFAW